MGLLGLNRKSHPLTSLCYVSPPPSSDIETSHTGLTGTTFSARFSRLQSVHCCWVEHLVGAVIRQQQPLLDKTTIQTGFFTRAFELSPPARDLLSAEPMFQGSEGSATASALRARHEMILHWDTLCRGKPTMPSKTRTRWAARFRRTMILRSYASNATISRIVKCHYHHGLSMFKKWRNTGRCARQTPMAIRMGDLST